MRKPVTIVRVLLAMLVPVALLLVAACSGDEGVIPLASNDSRDSRDDSAAFMMEESQPSGQPAPQATPTPPAMMESMDGAEGPAGSPGSPGSPRLSPLAQNRIIVHTARMAIIVDDVAATVDRIADMAASLGGWLVSSDRTSKHTGAIAIRVPAASLDQALGMIERAARDVVTSAVTSDDVTDQYVDERLSGVIEDRDLTRFIL